MQQTDVFVSYAREDAAVVRMLAERLGSDFVVWWDTDIIAGESFEHRILKVLRESRVVICVVSRASVASEWVRKEVDAAVELKLPVIPIVIDGGELPPWLAHLNAMFIPPGEPQQLEAVVARLTRDLSLYRATASPGEAGVTSEANVRERKSGALFVLSASSAIAVIFFVVTWILIPGYFAAEDEKREREKAEWHENFNREQLERKTASGEVMTETQAAWVEASLNSCDVARAASQATFVYYTNFHTKKAYEEEFKDSVPIAEASARYNARPWLHDLCRSRFGTNQETTKLCSDAIVYLQVHGRVDARLEQALITLETGEVGDTPTCTVATRTELLLRGAISDERADEWGLSKAVAAPGLPNLSRFAACFRREPYSEAGLKAQSTGQFRPMEDRLLEAGCIKAGAPETGAPVDAGLAFLISRTGWDTAQAADAAVMHPPRPEALDDMKASLAALSAEQKNIRGIAFVFSGDKALQRAGFMLFVEAAEAGNLEATANMGLCELLGIGAPADPASGSASVRAALAKGLKPDAASWAWKESLQSFEVGDVVRATRHLDLSAQRGDPVAKAYLGVLKTQGVASAVCQPDCVDAARAIAADLEAAGHSEWASVVDEAIAQSETASRTQSTLETKVGVPSLKIDPEIAPEPALRKPPPEVGFWERVGRFIRKR